MSLRNIQHSSGLIDESLDYIVTTMRIHESYIDQAPDWLREKAYPLRAIRPRIEWALDRAQREQPVSSDRDDLLQDEHPQVFIGTPKVPLLGVAAPKLVRHFAEIGIVPRKRKVIFRGKKHDGRLFDVNLYWNRQNSRNDSAATAEFIDETTEFFLLWQMKYGWSCRGLEFVTDTRVINLFFSDRRWMPPSDRQHEIIVSTDERTGEKRLVAI